MQFGDIPPTPVHKAQKKIYVCFRFPDPTYIFGPTLNILLC